MNFITMPHEQAMPYWNNLQWQGNYSNPYVHYNCSNYSSSLGWSSYQNTGDWRPPLPESTVRLERTLERFIQASEAYRPPLPESTVKLERTLERFIQVSEEYNHDLEICNHHLEISREQLANQMSRLGYGSSSNNNQTIPEEQCQAITERSSAIIEDGMVDNLKVEEEVVKREEKVDEKKEGRESEEEKEVGVENLETFVNIKNQKIEKKKIEEEKEDLRVRVEALKRANIPYPLVPTKSSRDEYYEEVCEILVPTPMPTLHTDVKSQEVKVNDKVFLPSFDDGKPKVKMRDVTKDGGSNPFVCPLKLPWPNGGISFLKHFCGGLQLEGRKYSSLACLKPP